MTEGLAEARQRDEEAFRERQAELDQSFRDRVAQLTEKEAELEQRRQELNDRDTHLTWTEPAGSSKLFSK
jgi:Skp family chaperone for outer membrane proteins